MDAASIFMSFHGRRAPGAVRSSYCAQSALGPPLYPDCARATVLISVLCSFRRARSPLRAPRVLAVRWSLAFDRAQMKEHKSAPPARLARRTEVMKNAADSRPTTSCISPFPPSTQRKGGSSL